MHEDGSFVGQSGVPWTSHVVVRDGVGANDYGLRGGGETGHAYVLVCVGVCAGWGWGLDKATCVDELT